MKAIAKIETDISESIQQLRNSIPQAGIANREVSEWSVGMHIHHCGLAMTGMARALIDSKPPLPKSSFSLLRAAVFLSGRIPRGRGKAPKPSRPKEYPSAEELEDVLCLSEKLIEEVKLLANDRWFKHFAFGVLNRNQTLRLFAIHNNHHLRIIRDIVGVK